MKRVDAPEILDTDACDPAEVRVSMRDLARVNRWFGGVSTTRKMVERASDATGEKRLSLLEVAAGSGDVPKLVQRKVARRGIDLNITLLDRARSHLPPRDNNGEGNALVADALALPFGTETFDLVSCNLFAHHLDTPQLANFVREALRVSRLAVLINDLIRHPLHLALAYAGFPIIRSRIAWLDGLTSVRRAYLPQEMKAMVASAIPVDAERQIEVSENYLFRMGCIVWKRPPFKRLR